MYQPRQVKVTKSFMEFRIYTGAESIGARDLTDAIHVADEWISTNYPDLAGYDDRFSVSVEDETIVLTVATVETGTGAAI